MNMTADVRSGEGYGKSCSATVSLASGLTEIEFAPGAGEPMMGVCADCDHRESGIDGRYHPSGGRRRGRSQA